MLTDNLMVNVDWLAEHLNDENLVLLDASMQKVVGRPAIEYDQPIYIPCSLRFDLETLFVNPDSNLPHTLPDEIRFTRLAQELGIHNDSHLVIYDNQGIYSSPRAWWMFRVMGHARVSILNGGLPAWLKAGYTTQMQSSEPSEKGCFQACLQPEWISSTEEVLKSLDNPHTHIIDARSAARFSGEAPEPRPGLRSGHIPGSFNLPFLDIMQDNGYQPIEMMTQSFSKLPINTDSRLIFSCGSGITACILLLAAAQVGYSNLSVYDGSWSEWGADRNLPLESSSNYLMQ